MIHDAQYIPTDDDYICDLENKVDELKQEIENLKKENKELYHFRRCHERELRDVFTPIFIPLIILFIIKDIFGESAISVPDTWPVRLLLYVALPACVLWLLWPSFVSRSRKDE